MTDRQRFVGHWRHNAGWSPYVALVSMQRSGSSEFAANLASALGEGSVDIDEFFTKGLQANSPPSLCNYNNTNPRLHFSDTRSEYYARLLAPQAKLQATRDACCSDTSKAPAAACVIVYKLFDFNLWATEGMAQGAIFPPRGNGTALLLRDPRTCVIVLERSPEQRYCSWLNSIQTGDWTHMVNGVRQHVHPNCSSKNESSGLERRRRRDFMERHAAWYRYLRQSVLVGVRHLELTFEQVTTEPQRTFALVGKHCSR